MKKEKLQTTPQKYKRSQEIITNIYMPIKWTTQKKWKNSQKCTNVLRLNQEVIEKIKKPITSNEFESLI